MRAVLAPSSVVQATQSRSYSPVQSIPVLSITVQSCVAVVKRCPVQCSPGLSLVLPSSQPQHRAINLAQPHIPVQRSVALMADPTKEVVSVGPISIAASSIILDTSRLDGKNWHSTSPLVIFPVTGMLNPSVLIVVIHINFLMVLKPEFETLQTQILNTSPLSSLYEAFAIIDDDERKRKLLPASSLPETSPTVPNQTSFIVPIGTHSYCQHCHKPSYLIDRCFNLHLELKSQLNQNRGGGGVGGRGGGRGHVIPRVSTIAEVEPMHVELPNLNQLQTQIAQLQLHLGLAPSSSFSGPIANIAVESHIALHGKLGHPNWILEYGANNHMVNELATFTSLVTFVNQYVCIADGSSISIRSQGSPSTPGTTSELIVQEDSTPPCPFPILESPSPSPSGSHAPTPLPTSSLDSDADYAGSKIDRRSTSGFYTFHGSHLISWKDKK
ncbi:hypothetical protein Acr_21g0001970 [Actinidia rufa]|uniref:Uncharacterized protein n=1 Tax=Actinidia rufa TaxID=165716 RepID=A0A7J0GFW8_9ERIC|nr:hypothetical protein Acr_21g0001970 [Actinidia rufa]